MIAEKNSAGEDESWMVVPCPGYVLKFKKVNLGSDLFTDSAAYKLFLNISHCEEMPAPLEDLEEDEVAEILDSEDPSRYKIPLCVGELECVRDNKDENSAKVDVIINSGFFKKRVEKKEFFRQLLSLVIAEAIEKKHGIKIEPKDAIRLRNRKVMGAVSAQRIRKRPEKSVIEEVCREDDEDSKIASMRGDGISVENCIMVLHDGVTLEVKCRLPELLDGVDKPHGLHVKINEDHVLIHDHFHTLFDFYVPLKMAYQNAKSTLSLSQKILKIIVPVTC